MSVTYLVQYGKPAYLGRFTSNGEESYSRGSRVVIDGPRGIEIGTILCEPQTRFANDLNDGGLLRSATSQDESDAVAKDVLGLDLVQFSRQRRDELNLSFEPIDAEVSLDSRTAVLHGLAWSDCDIGPLLEELSTRFHLIVRLLDLAHGAIVPEEPAGCGKPDCGSGGGCTSCGTDGGCSSKSCSSGKVKSARELTAYFADLRKQMEASNMQRTPLV